MRGIIRHSAEAVGHHVEEISEGRLAQALLMKSRWLLVSALRNHALAIPHARVAGGAINVEALAAAAEDLFRHWKRHVVARIGADLAGVEIRVLMQLAAGDRAFDRGTGRAQVSIKIAHRIGLEARLVVHVVTATGENKHCCEGRDKYEIVGRRASRASACTGEDARAPTFKYAVEARHQLGTSAMEVGFRPSRNCRVRSASYFLSEEKITRKKRSLDARSNCGTLNTG